MSKSKSCWVIIFLLLGSSFTFLVKGAAAETETLAQATTRIIDDIDPENYDSWLTVYGQMLSLDNASAFDYTVSKDVSSGDYLDALFVAELAELNNYTSPVLVNCTIEALEKMPMCGSLPITSGTLGYGDPNVVNNGAFMLHNRFVLHVYKYAQEYNITRWNLQQAYTDFLEAYNSTGEMLWVDPEENWAKSYSGRYYDEHAETLSMFLEFAKEGIPDALQYADEVWEKTQSHWNGQYYYYSDASRFVECEMGNFAQIIAEYKNFKDGNISYWDRVLEDLNYKLLEKGVNSPGWSPKNPGVIMHATTNPQLRLTETMSVLIALHMLYPNLTVEMRQNFAGLLTGNSTNPPAWKGLINSALNKNDTFAMTDNSGASNSATSLAAMVLFLEGIVPDDGYLVINPSEQQFPDERSCLPISDFGFNAENRTIRIPVSQGTLTFIYGSNPVKVTFNERGVYTLQFSNDWSQVLGAEKDGNKTVVDINYDTSDGNEPAPAETPLVTPQPYEPPNIPSIIGKYAANQQTNQSTEGNPQKNQTTPTLEPPTTSEPETRHSNIAPQGYLFIVIVIMAVCVGIIIAIKKRQKTED